MDHHDLSWMKAPAVLSVSNAETLDHPANTPTGHRAVEVEKRYEDIDYLPAAPHISGVYLYADLVYPALSIGFSLFELYHAESGVNLRPKLYLTKAPLAGVAGTDFSRSKNSHRLIWINDNAQAAKFIDFITSYVFTRREKKEASGIQSLPLAAQYPADDGVKRVVSCIYLVPFSTKGGYVHDLSGSLRSPYPVFSWKAFAAHPAAKALRVQAEAMWQSS